MANTLPPPPTTPAHLSAITRTSSPVDCRPIFQLSPALRDCSLAPLRQNAEMALVPSLFSRRTSPIPAHTNAAETPSPLRNPFNVAHVGSSSSNNARSVAETQKAALVNPRLLLMCLVARLNTETPEMALEAPFSLCSPPIEHRNTRDGLGSSLLAVLAVRLNTETPEMALEAPFSLCSPSA